MACCCKASSQRSAEYGTLGEDGDTQTRKNWQQKWDAVWRGTLQRMKWLRDVVVNNDAQGDVDEVVAMQDPRRSYAVAFSILLRLYAHDSGVLQAVYNIYERNPAAFEFYIPQLANFLFRGRYEQNDKLLCFMLDKCERSVQFSHRLLFFCRSFCQAEAQALKSEFIDNCFAGPVLEEKSRGGGRKESKRRTLLGAIEQQGSAAMANVQGALAKRHHAGTGEQEQNHDELTGAAKVAVPAAGDSDYNMFDLTTNFVCSMTKLSLDLKSTARKDRTDRLRAELKVIAARFRTLEAGRRGLYMPLGSRFCEILAIHPDESFAFSTKERVPFLVCLECIDHGNDFKPKPRSPDQKAHKKSEHATGAKYGQNRRRALSSDIELSMRPRQQFRNSFDGIPRSKTAGLGSRMVDTDLTKPNSPHTSSPGSSPTLTGISQWDTRLRTPPRVRGMGQKHPMKLPLKLKLPLAAIRSSSDRSFNRDGSMVELKQSLLEEGKKSPTPFAIEVKDSETRLRDDSDVSVQRQLKKATEEDRTSITSGFESGHDDLSAGGIPHIEDDSESEDEFSPGGTGTSAMDQKSLIEMHEMQGLAQSSVLSENRGDIFQERWIEKEMRLRAASSMKDHPRWCLLPVIIKANDDLRQEQFAAQLIRQFKLIFQMERVPLWVKAYDILATSPTAGIMEAVPDTISLHGLRKKLNSGSLLGFFKDFFPTKEAKRLGHLPRGAELRVTLAKARKNFCASLAAYSIICYLLNVKDRHNGNILLDAEGHIIHIDFGFLLSNSPGKNANFEKSPFKLTEDYIGVLGGARSRLFRRFRALFIRGFLAARKHRDTILTLVEMMLAGNEELPCFSVRPKKIISELSARFRPDLSTRACVDFCHTLIHDANGNFSTRCYDRYQYCCVGIF